MKTLMYLEQDVGPAAARKVPPVFRGILRRMCAAAAVDVFKVCRVSFMHWLGSTCLCSSFKGVSGRI